jgi:hypothetical protein
MQKTQKNGVWRRKETVNGPGGQGNTTELSSKFIAILPFIFSKCH